MNTFDVVALVFLAGLVIGALVVVAGIGARQLVAAGRGPGDKDQARDLAMRTVLSLDDLVGACYSASRDFPEFDEDEPASFFLHTDDPVLVLPKDADWSLLGRDLADEIRWLPNRLRNVVDALESIEIDPPDFNDLFEHRQDDFSRIGLRALDLIDQLCANYELSHPERPSYYKPREGFVEKVREMEQLWKRRAESALHVPPQPSNVTPIFGRNVPGESQTV